MVRMDDETREARRRVARGQERKGTRLDLNGEHAGAAQKYENAARSLDGTGERVAVALLTMRAAIAWAHAGDTKRAVALYSGTGGPNGIDALSVASAGIALREELAAALDVDAPHVSAQVRRDAKRAQLRLARGEGRAARALDRSTSGPAERGPAGRLDQAFAAALAGRGRSPRGRDPHKRPF